jgi:hypothetical protein
MRHRPAPAPSNYLPDQRSLPLTSAFIREASIAMLVRCAELFGPPPGGGYSTEQHLTALRQLESERRLVLSVPGVQLVDDQGRPVMWADWLTEVLKIW